MKSPLRLEDYKLSTGYAVTDLPTAWIRETGRIIIEWAFLHYRLKRLTYRVMNVGDKTGRLAITEPKLAEHVDMLRTLLSLRKISTKADFKSLRELVESATSYRDKLAHSVWVRDFETKELTIQITKNVWTPKGTRGKVSRKIIPEGNTYDMSTFRNIRQFIADAVKILDDLEREVMPLLPKSLQTLP